MNEVITGDCLSTLRFMSPESVDLLVTDPPYGYSFMGKDWDKAVPSVEIWQECLRVLKPGAFAFVMSAPRQDVLSQMIVRLGMAGFDTSFTSIYWTYASGFPKAANVGKLVDKRYKERPEYNQLADYIKEARIKSGKSQKDIAQLFPSKTGGITGCVWNWENAQNVPTEEQWAILKQTLSLDDKFDLLIQQETKRYEEAEREVIAKSDKGAKSIYGNSMDSKELDITKAATPQAKALDGSYAGFQPKPAVEVIIVAMKPLSEKTYVDQALANGKGITWLDDCRIPYENEDDIAGTRTGFTGFGYRHYCQDKGYDRITENGKDEKVEQNPQGRFPANLLVSDDILNDGRITKSRAYPRRECKTPEGNTYMTDKPTGQEHNDSGSYSRYFDLDKWAEKTLPFLIVPKASKSEKDKGLEDREPQMRSESNKMMGDAGVMKTGSGNDRRVLFKNNHPTVKPLRLMSYLITMGSRPNDIVLDPFCGSGTTCLAAKQLGRQYLGIELSEEYATIARKRLESVEPNLLSF